MNREDIIKLAREAGIEAEKDTLCRYKGWVEPLTRFAELVRADEREACAQIVETPVGEYEVVVACGGDPAQRRIPMYLSWNQAADAIRARGKT